MNNIILNLSPDVVDHIRHQFVKGLFVWQARWKANQHHQNRFLHKRRQAGADYYFVLEALNDARLTGQNKIFMANKELLPNFVYNIAQYFPQQQERLIENAEEIRLLTLSNGAEIRFLHENSCPVSISGDVYVSEWAYDVAEYLALLIRKDNAEVQQKMQALSTRQCGKCGECLPVSECCFSGEAACWATRGWHEVKL
ncbi:hypothetical protein [Xenorhabdus bovienii]|uniref:hypothetical protein n=1 Tax=Xenorhabdus bovienii TaxID=40576 RepID=UPI0023B28490|nr:hypothetical protein [Xenorhabdus bovienii]MDE9544978.1 hypothetical protein [Xenorhabdus bovienii]